jgi:hypothetical protein
MMGRSKEMGKAVDELTADELQSERSRCQIMAQWTGNAHLRKSLLKRLRQIEERLEKENSN